MPLKNISCRLLSALAMMAALLAPAVTATARDGVKQKLDSAWIVMGHVTTLHVDATVDGSLQGVRLVVPDNEYPPEVEANTADAVTDTVRLSDNRYELRRSVTIQSFDSGLYRLPPALLIRGNDTLRSDSPALKVVPVDVDSLQDIHPFKGALFGGKKWYDAFPDWLIEYGVWILLGLALFAGGVIYYLRYHKVMRAVESGEKKSDEPPYDVALRQLNALQAEHLCENGREKEYYTRLTDILRVYLHDGFGINAMEMTSGQIIQELHNNPSTALSQSQMQEVLKMADYVKFARMRPMPDDNRNAFQQAMQFVNDTRSAIVNPADEGAAGNAPDSQTNSKGVIS